MRVRIYWSGVGKSKEGIFRVKIIGDYWRFEWRIWEIKRVILKVDGR